MPGGKSPKRKGNVYERELVNAANECGIQAKRAYASNGESLGHHAEVDCLIGGFKIQAKRRRILPKLLAVPEECDCLIARADNDTSVVVMRYFDWLDLIKEAQE